MKNNQNNHWPKLPKGLEKCTIFSTDSKYDQLRSNYFRSGTPQAIIMARSENDIVKAIKYVNKIKCTLNKNIPFSIRSGGHGITLSSVNDDGIILDVSHLNRTKIINADKGLVKVQSGAVWGDVAQKLSPRNLIISSGDFGDTGVGGLTVYGGIGLLVRYLGLTIDHVIAAKIATANGKILIIDRTHYPDLFWALRGGGFQFGVVIEFFFKANKLIDQSDTLKTPVDLQNISYQVTNLEQFINRWQKWISNSETKLTSLLMVTNQSCNSFTVKATNIWAGIGNDNTNKLFNQAAKLAQVNEDRIKSISYDSLVAAPHIPHSGQQNVYVKNTLVNNFNPQISKEIKKILKEMKPLGIELRYIGGALNTVNSSETSWTNRAARGFIALWVEGDKEYQAKKAFKKLLDLGIGVYGGYSSDLSDKENNRVWPDANDYNRLKKISKQMDPNKLFNQGRRI